VADAAPDRPAVPSPATDYCAALFCAFVENGMTDIVVCPGSRSQAPALVAAALERGGQVRLHVRIDERAAGFLALGLALESGRPVAVVVTSGTGAAELHPAVLEADSSGVPMILVTADRPAELRGIRSNQTTHQPGLFGRAARLSEDVAAPRGDDGERASAAALGIRAIEAALGTRTAAPGPVQLNLGLREPLSSGLPDVAGVVPGPLPAAVAPSVDGRLPLVTLSLGPRTVVIAGNAAGADAEELAHAGAWPLVAEPSSGARFGRNLVVPYRRLLDDPAFAADIERVVIFGHPTLSRQVPAVAARAGVETVVIAPSGAEVYDPGHAAAVVARAATVEAGSPDRAWLGRWVVASRAILAESDPSTAPDLEAAHSTDAKVRRAFLAAELAEARAPITRRMLADAVWRATWPHDRLVFGASRLIREADEVVPGKNIRVYANRGLAGIDGTLATATGIALAAEADGGGLGGTGVTRVLLGDLTFLYDVTALLAAPGEPRPRMQIVVGNDGGGTIFDSLEVASVADAEAFARVVTTPRAADLAALATAFGCGYRRLTTRAELEGALTSAAAGIEILEVPLPPSPIAAAAAAH
jgi:2-succinyl-5-enolpyruvyl-6-hydroxy-3-cyclohexene-1-carboxylate synthase